MRYALIISYNGAGFCGWQVQPDAPSVQAALEDALCRLLGSETGVTGAGRTDTGVNARGYVAHFDTGKAVDTAEMTYKLNAILPSSVVVHEVRAVADDFHARFDATRREYTYFLHTEKDPFLAGFSYLCTYKLDFEAMNRAARMLLGTHDFSCFEKTGTDNKTSICTVFEAEWSPVRGLPVSKDGHCWQFRIAADRFLRNMVRAITGTLIEVGRGKRSADSITELIVSRDRCQAGESVPGHALFLTGVDYDTLKR